MWKQFLYSIRRKNFLLLPLILKIENGELWAWGVNNQGQLGLGNCFNEEGVKKIDLLKDYKFIDICCGANHSLAITGIFNCK